MRDLTFLVTSAITASVLGKMREETGMAAWVVMMAKTQAVTTLRGRSLCLVMSIPDLDAATTSEPDKGRLKSG